MKSPNLERKGDDKAELRIFQPDQVTILVIYSFAQQIFIVYSKPDTILDAGDTAVNRQTRKVSKYIVCQRVINTMKKKEIRQGREVGTWEGGQFVILNKVSKEILNEKVTFESRPVGGG